ncbi:hypothetical protein GCM10012320_08090 [Sinomonas cellulolyticus]|uniref:Helix-turn-helix domain-containing protein n=1 Tax=Sinomonas cellulolyticus TaxID=2801916 RepID=A0ABS1K3P0_9MICC|nr:MULTISPECIES: recombinase family protein [Sinomonas]MBL0706274.1 helix-turn-helix domain-containing protein [Sinomonas cellulolyticus]GHG43797.1 hypothetical protein GCM10012320_08090 [Sinomonas sp. KCTC 49339]
MTLTQQDNSRGNAKSLDGRLVNTVGLDATRAPLILKAWELYATGDYTLDRLEDAMAGMGLTSKATARTAERPVTASKFQQILRDPYYAGYVVYKGDVYPGRHEPIVGHEFFEHVQEVADMRSKKGQRDRVHHHYLKGQLYCQRCHENGRISRLVYTEATGNGGTYQYFVCLSRKQQGCDLPYLPVERVEDALVDHYKGLHLPSAFLDDLRTRIDTALADEQGSIREIHARVSRQLKELYAREERLVDLASDGLLPHQKIRAKLYETQFQKAKARDSLATTSAELAVGGNVLRTALELIHDPSGIYERLADSVRRLMNQALFERIYVDEHSTVSTRMSPPFADIYAARTLWEAPEAPRGAGTPSGGTERRPRNAGAPDLISLPGVYSTSGSNKTPMVGLLHSCVENVQQRKRILKLRKLRDRLAHAEPRETAPGPAREVKTQAREAIELYQSGISTTQIARRLNVSRTTVAGWIKAAGIPMRHSPITDEQFAEVRRLRDQGLSYERIGRQIGYTASGVRRRLLEDDS